MEHELYHLCTLGLQLLSCDPWIGSSCGLALLRYKDGQLRDVPPAFSCHCYVIGWLPRAFIATGIHSTFANLGPSTPDLGKRSSTHHELTYV